MPKIICLEGCSGTGKTTQARKISEYLTQRHIRCKKISEKEYSPFSDEVLYWHQNERGQDFTWEIISRFARARGKLHNYIAKEFSNYDILLFDRSYFTGAVYQSNNGKLSQEKIIDMSLDEGALPIEQGFLLDCPPELSFQRVEQRARKLGNAKPFVSVGCHTFPSVHGTVDGITRLHELYRRLLPNHLELVLIDAAKPENDVSDEILGLL